LRRACKLKEGEVSKFISLRDASKLWIVILTFSFLILTIRVDQ